MKQTLLDKFWDAHTVRVEDGGRCVLYIDRQYIHEVTSPVAFPGDSVYVLPAFLIIHNKLLLFP